MANKKNGWMKKLIKGYKDVTGGFLSAGNVRDSQARGELAGLKGAAIYKAKVPKGLPEKVRNDAFTAIEKMAKEGNYSGIRKYLKGLN